MSWLDLFFLALFLNLGLSTIVIVLHRQNDGVSPWWEVSLFVSVVLWLITVLVRIGSDVLGLPFAGGGVAVQTFFWAGLSVVVSLWATAELLSGYREYREFLASDRNPAP